ncbi:putative MFS metabolite transporter [hydrothermal vent metagenome]|uniref:Putative MFS metabolite transporter n=1 Tax=hydrothermal vent metagenome TaxID=652676 RepID=A0A1W1CHQ7_9ZZZZ
MFQLLSFFYYFYFSIIGIYIIFLPKVLSEVGYSASEIGIIFSAAPLVRFILPFLFMRGLHLSANIFKASLLVIVLSVCSFYLSVENFWALLVSNIVMGVGMSLVLPYIETIALHSIGKERYGKSRLYGSLGFIIVALILVKFLSSAYIAFDFLLILSIITAVVALGVQQRSSKEQNGVDARLSNDIHLLQDWQLWAGLVLMQMSFGAFYNFFTIYETDHGISLDMTVYLWSFGVFIEIVMFFFQGKLLHFDLLNIIRFTMLATILRWFLVFAFATNLPMLFFAQSLHALSFALFHSAAISYLFHLYKNKSLAQQLFSGMGYGLGGLSGAMLSGYIYEYYPSYLFLSSAFIAFGAYLSISLWKKKSQGVIMD